MVFECVRTVACQQNLCSHNGFCSHSSDGFSKTFVPIMVWARASGTALQKIVCSHSVFRTCSYTSCSKTPVPTVVSNVFLQQLVKKRCSHNVSYSYSSNSFSTTRAPILILASASDTALQKMVVAIVFCACVLTQAVQKRLFP